MHFNEKKTLKNITMCTRFYKADYTLATTNQPQLQLKRDKLTEHLIHS